MIDYIPTKNTTKAGNIMNIKFIIAVVVLTIIALIFSSSLGESEETTTQATKSTATVTTTQKATTTTTTKPTEQDVSQEDVSVAVTSPAETFDVLAPNAGLYNISTATILYEKNADEKIAPASLAKLLTAITALTYMESDTIITVGSELDLVPQRSSICQIAKGHKLTLYDLLTGMLLASGNDAAYTIAVNVARHVSDADKLSDKDALQYFIDLMNRTAKNIGCTRSKFKSPDGSDTEGQYTTVSDLSIIGYRAYTYETIREIVATASKKVVFASGQHITWSNTNKLLHKDSEFYMPGVIGMKTGSTTAAGNCLIAVSNANGEIYLSIVAGCKTDNERYNSSKNLLSHPLSK